MTSELNWSLVLVIFIVTAAIVVGNITREKCEPCQIPETSLPDGCDGCDSVCGLKANNCLGQSVTISGSAESVREKTSASGNTYYTFDVCENSFCIDAFSWTNPTDLDEFSGVYDDTGYGPQLTLQEGKTEIQDEAYGECLLECIEFNADNETDMSDPKLNEYCIEFCKYGTDSELELVSEYGEI